MPRIHNGPGGDETVIAHVANSSHADKCAARHYLFPYNVVTAVRGDLKVQFILGVFIFVLVIGLIDAKLPWPDPRFKDRAP